MQLRFGERNVRNNSYILAGDIISAAQSGKSAKRKKVEEKNSDKKEERRNERQRKERKMRS